MKNVCNKILTVLVSTMAGAALAVVPEVSDVTIAQAENRMVTVTYKLANGPAVVTVDFQTNCVVEGVTQWASIGYENFTNIGTDSDVWKKIPAGDETHAITWRPNRSWPNHVIPAGGARALVTAWPLNNTPDYLVVDISEGAQPNTERYYPAVECLPGGLFSNKVYRQTMLVMKRVNAKGMPWTMGSISEVSRDSASEVSHQIVLTNDYYLAVFETTQQQCTLLGYHNPYFSSASDERMRPEDRVPYNLIFCKSAAADATYFYPNAPHANSLLGVLNARTGLDFTLPTEAEWEYACRAGTIEGQWNDGSYHLYNGTAVDANLPGRYRSNGAESPARDCDPSIGGTAIVGSYAPNHWGFYDMHGNVAEWCLDWYEADIVSLKGAVNIDYANPSQTADGTTGQYRVTRGGTYAYAPSTCRSARRKDALDPAQEAVNMPTSYLRGFRLYCRAGLD